LSINTVVSTVLEVSSKLTNAVEPITINIPFIKRKNKKEEPTKEEPTKEEPTKEEPTKEEP